MRKLRLQWALPIAFLALSAMELTWANRLDTLILPFHSYIGSIRSLWYALNAPTLFFLAIAIHYAPIRLSQNFPHIWMDIGLFLAGGVILWFCIGRILDRRKQNTPAKVPTKGTRAAQVFVLLWGIYVCRQGLQAVSAVDYLGRHVPGSVLDGALVLLWSAILIILPARSLRRVARSRAKPTHPTTAQYPHASH
jgi:hypothetical protein